MTWKDDTYLIHNYFLHDKNWSRDEEITFTCLALAGESGEIANLWKKVLRNADDVPDIKHEMSNEIADVFMYLFALAELFDVNIDEACEEKIKELKQRWPQIWENQSAGVWR